MLRGRTRLGGCVGATAIFAAIVFPGAAVAAPGGNGPDGTGAPGNPHAPGTTGNPHQPGTTGNPHQGQPPYGVANGPSKSQGNGTSNAGGNSAGGSGGSGGNRGGGSPPPSRGRGNGPSPQAGGNSGGTPNGPPGKTTICHRTGSDTNPYVEITVANPAVQNGHSHHGDLIPAPSGGCEGSAPVVPSVNAALNPATAAPLSAQGALAQSSPADTSAGDSTSAGGGGGASLDPAADPAESVAGEAAASEEGEGGTLPFTGLVLGTLLSVAVMLLLSGWLIRRLGLRTS